jgi:hypothetical protein
MVNNTMSDNKQLPADLPKIQPEKRPNDTGAVAIEGTIKIFDPASRKVFVEQSA